MKTVFVDVDTQLDFLSPSGALYVPGAEVIVDNVARLNRWAESQGILVISDTDAHRENDPEFADWPPHCVAGTLGQQKPAATLLAQRVAVASDASVPELSGIAQVILEKQTLDCFGCPNMATLLERLAPRLSVRVYALALHRFRLDDRIDAAAPQRHQPGERTEAGEPGGAHLP